MTSDYFHQTYADDRYDPSWRHINGETLTDSLTLSADVVIIGSGAGGGVTAEILAEAGLSVLIIEEGPLKTAKDFRMREDEAYAQLYQEAAARKTKDKAINILQGRSVGGSTTVNWTSSFRTPKPTREYWQHEFGTTGVDDAVMQPWFERAEARFGIAPWPVAPNANNAALRDGAARMGWHAEVIPRNVRGCANLGYCGTGCPMNAKQSMLITTIPHALALGATLVSRVRIETLNWQGSRVQSATGTAMDAFGQHRDGVRVNVTGKHFVLSGGAINTPALLLRSQLPDPNRLIGARTFLHPVVISVALMPTPVHADAGAPQSIYSDEFVWKHGVSERCGYKLEVPPVHPLIGSTILLRHGLEHAGFMRELPRVQATLALIRDGFHPQSVGGRVELDAHGDALLDYPVTGYLLDGMHDAYLRMAELQFAAGAEQVLPLHKDATPYRALAQAKTAIAGLAKDPLRTQMVSAHVMGGCAFGEDAAKTVCDSHGRLRGFDNLSVHDGSLFPTSLGVNPQLSIYGLVMKLATELAGELTH
ncbi:GMC family oxidoreductase [Permianibacter sp. IMCC34836]|uniref:GMC family oxidoreductase n=1 Tax=Permianibacter fluminis TaxID=2738515 RepID=UPI0015579BE9|nr:GMC family oxidoreductase [Permianibacter fluminis]NQD36303.1 GMC family oxidoreductase [Permianibacter fluminis]